MNGLCVFKTERQTFFSLSTTHTTNNGSINSQRLRGCICSIYVTNLQKSFFGTFHKSHAETENDKCLHFALVKTTHMAKLTQTLLRFTYMPSDRPIKGSHGMKFPSFEGVIACKKSNMSQYLSGVKSQMFLSIEMTVF